MDKPMKLEDFLKLTEQEEKVQNEILALVKSNETNSNTITIEALKGVLDKNKTDLSTLIKLAIVNNKIDAICKSPQFDEIWELQWRRSYTPDRHDYEHKADHTHEYDPIPTCSCLNLLKGLYIYNAYHDLVTGKEITQELRTDAKAYLKRAAEFGCFYALNALCVNGLHIARKLKNQENGQKKVEIYSLLDQVLKYALQAADLYWTPGYYLLANVYQELTLYAETLFPQVPSTKSKKLLYSEALIALNVAQKLEDNSTAMINCAYHGKSLKEATRNKFTGWLPAKLKLKEKYGNLLKDTDVRYLMTQADKIIKKIMNGHKSVFSTNHDAKTLTHA